MTSVGVAPLWQTSQCLDNFLSSEKEGEFGYRFKMRQTLVETLALMEIEKPRIPSPPIWGCSRGRDTNLNLEMPPKNMNFNMETKVFRNVIFFVASHTSHFRVFPRSVQSKLFDHFSSFYFAMSSFKKVFRFLYVKEDANTQSNTQWTLNNVVLSGWEIVHSPPHFYSFSVLSKLSVLSIAF